VAHGVTGSMSPYARVWRVIRENSLLMVAGAVIALVWANLDHDSYERATHPLHFVVNDIAMVFFFGLAMKEIIEATAPGGALHSVRRAGLPVIAAIGGMAGPALLYVAMALAVDRPDIIRGWAVPSATDIAFSYLVARAIFPAASPAIPFLLLLAIADDAFGLILLATFYPSAPVVPVYVIGLVGGGCGLAYALKRWRVRTFWPYVGIGGMLSWWGLYLGGLHPALALVPVLPFVPHAKRDPGLFVEPRHPGHDPLTRFEHWWKLPVEIILFMFALVNAGVPVSNIGTTTWIVLTALVVGKPLGIVTFTWIAERAGFHRAPGLTWPLMLILGVTAGIGFTVALFFTTAAFVPGPTLDQAKLGALLSVSAGVVALALSKVMMKERVAR
jgi:NhaA family Na+:H+ antiporter